MSANYTARVELAACEHGGYTIEQSIKTAAGKLVEQRILWACNKATAEQVRDDLQAAGSSRIEKLTAGAQQ